MENIVQVIAQKQMESVDLEDELRELIPKAIGVEVNYKNKKGTINKIYKDGTADVIFIDEHLNENIEIVSLSELT